VQSKGGKVGGVIRGHKKDGVWRSSGMGGWNPSGAKKTGSRTKFCPSGGSWGGEKVKTVRHFTKFRNDTLGKKFESKKGPGRKKKRLGKKDKRFPGSREAREGEGAKTPPE